MTKRRLMLIAGFVPVLCMVALIGLERLEADATAAVLLVIGAEILLFALPAVLLMLASKRVGKTGGHHLGGFSPRALPFVLFFSGAIVFSSFVINFLLLSLGVVADGATQAATPDVPLALTLAAAFVAVLCEELFFRGALLSVSETGGTAAAIFASSLAFALVHGSPANFAGPLLAGLGLGYMCHILGSVWPCVFAHLLHNLYSTGMGRLAGLYESLGLWPYFMVFNVLAFFICFFVSMRCLQSLIRRGKAARFKPAPLGAAAVTVASPGLLLLLLVYAMKIIYA